MNDIDVLLTENRKFPPGEEFKRSALVSTPELYEEAERDPIAFWERMAGELQWIRKCDKALDWTPPHAQWFVGGKLNVSANCLDRHLEKRGDKTALIWEGEPGEIRNISYRELHAEVSRFANVLKSLGVVSGDRVAIYMPLIPEAAVAMLACARIGAAHSVVFGGFSSDALKDRIQDAEAKLVITATSGYRRGSIVPLKQTHGRSQFMPPRWHVGQT
jgi:acetyl-CoA synthetase